MKQFPHLIGLAIMVIIIQSGSTSAASLDTTTIPIAGGSIYFDTIPPGATIWLDNIELGTSPLTYYSEKTGTREVRLRKRLFEDYTDTVNVIEGERVVFYARLIPVSSIIADEIPAPAPVTTATTISTSTIKIPTPWPTPSPESAVDPAVVIGSVAMGIAFFMIGRR